ncbi:zinc finger CCCH domain-containing protein 32-like [Phragmites australis]|uniref:zinc finger CCCH domain-containing protein 32-like n=1 Tax=Phragmites australis TaxID=29695 RepID=UPI002D79D796|nr:zinc finger CCCH domain-containing protein 32-like [Phragmites australis]
MEVDAAAAAAGAKPLTLEEEALRRSTDCVYFLASPLTCKKGNECDFRHSEGARMNPRDCWYWLNGNCLNPKCSFRHPPIDGLFGAPTPGVPSVSSHYGAYNSGNQMVPCYYFQKGNCLKGDRCHFYHGLQAAGNNPSEQVVKVPSIPLEQPQSQKNDESAEPNNSMQQRAPIIGDRSRMAVDLSMVHAAKTGVAAVPSELTSNAVKSRLNSEKVPNNTLAVKKSCEEDHPVGSDFIQDWNQDYKMPPTDDLPQNSGEADDFLGESSPGFDVLVDNDADGAAYLHDEEDFRRDMFPVEDYEYAPADFDIRAHHEREQFNGMGEHNQIGQLYDGYERKRRRSSSERSMDRPFHSDRRFLHREIDHAEMDGSDLRHQLRRRRINGSSTAISPEHNGEQYWRDEHYRERAHGGHHTHRDRRQAPRGSTLSARLQSRIKLPGKSPDRIDTRFENERDRRRLQDRLSPVRHMDFHGVRHREAGQHHERSLWRSSELASSVRHADGHSSRRDAVDSVHFAARKNLGEPRKANGIVESEDFEGPKPLSVILQRKREATVGNNSSSSYVKSAVAAVTQPGSLVEVDKKGCDNIVVSSEDCKSGSGDEEYTDEEKDQIPVEGQGQFSSHGDKFEVEDVTEVDPSENQEADNYDQREGESDDYETIQGHDYKSEDENMYQDDEDLDDDDDDFAQKVGVVFS